MKKPPTNPVVAEVMAAGELIVPSVMTDAANTIAATKDVHLHAGHEAIAAEPAKTKSAAVRMMTKSIAVAKPSAARVKARQIEDAAKPSQKPAGGGSGRPRRRGASKGR
jgi:hypothetical protein